MLFFWTQCSLDLRQLGDRDFLAHDRGIGYCQILLSLFGHYWRLACIAQWGMISTRCGVPTSLPHVWTRHRRNLVNRGLGSHEHDFLFFWLALFTLLGQHALVMLLQVVCMRCRHFVPTVIVTYVVCNQFQVFLAYLNQSSFGIDLLFTISLRSIFLITLFNDVYLVGRCYDCKRCVKVDRPLMVISYDPTRNFLLLNNWLPIHSCLSSMDVTTCVTCFRKVVVL